MESFQYTSDCLALWSQSRTRPGLHNMELRQLEGFGAGMLLHYSASSSVRVNYCAKHITVCCCCELQYFFSVAFLHLPQSSEVGNVFTFPRQSLPQAISSACPACWWSIVFRVPEGGNCSVCTCLYNHIQFWRLNVC